MLQDYQKTPPLAMQTTTGAKTEIEEGRKAEANREQTLCRAVPCSDKSVIAQAQHQTRRKTEVMLPIITIGLAGFSVNIAGKA
jgi:hypothetical protein